MNRLRQFALATLVALTFTACDEGADPVPPPPPPTPVGSITGTVTIDGEGATGVTVTLSSGASVATGAGGTFTFSGIEAGSYTVTISGYPDDATFPSQTHVATITADGQVVTLNFVGAFIRASSVVGQVLAVDAMMMDDGMGTGGGMGMGTPQADGLAGVTVTLGGMYAMGETTGTVPGGGFAFTGLRAGSYTVTISNLPGDVAFETTMMTVDVGVGELGQAIFTGAYVRASSISGSVMAEGDGIDGVTVTLGGDNAHGEHMMTHDGGHFAFDHLRAGSYTVTISGVPGDVSFPVMTKSVTVGTGSAGQVSFSEGAYVRTASVSGSVMVGDTGINGVSVTLSGDHAHGERMTTMDGGHFAFEGLRAGTYMVTIDNVPANLSFPVMTKSVTVGTGESGRVSFSEGAYVRSSSVSGSVMAEGDGVDGVTVTLTGEHADGQSMMTMDGGHFSFGDLRDGSYTVSISNLPEDINFPVTSKNVMVGVDQSGHVSFDEGTYVRQSSIVGQVATSSRVGESTYDDGESDAGVGGVDGVTVTLGGMYADGESMMTENGGRFAFTGLRAGTYTVTISGLPDDVRFESMMTEVTVALGQTSVVSAFEGGTELFEEGMIMGQFYIDGNENMVFERTVDAALPLAGAMVTLEGLGDTSMDMTTMTDDMGHYSFSGLDAGSYRVWLNTKEQVYKDAKVQSAGSGTVRVDLAQGASSDNDFPFVISTFDIMVPVMFGHDERTNENPAMGATVVLSTDPDGSGVVGKAAKTDDMGMAKISLGRSDVAKLAAKTVVFSTVTAPAKAMVSDDASIVFTLDKNKFNNGPSEDHNLLWTEVKVTAAYMEDGMPLPESRYYGSKSDGFSFEARLLRVSKDGKTTPALGDADASTAFLGRGSNGMLSFVVKGSALVHDMTYRAKDLTTINPDRRTGNHWMEKYDEHFRMAHSSSDNIGATTALVPIKDAAMNGVRLPRVMVTGKAVKQGTGASQVAEAALDGSTNMVHLGDFMVSYPFPEVKAMVWHEYNDMPGYQGPATGRGVDSVKVPGIDMMGDADIADMTINGVEMSYRLHYTGLSLPGDKFGDYTDGYVMCDESMGMISCVAPAAADSWMIQAVAMRGDTALAYDVAKRDPPVILLAEGGEDVMLDGTFTVANKYVDVSDMMPTVDMGKAPFSYKFVNARIEVSLFNKKGAGNRVYAAAPDTSDRMLNGVMLTVAPAEGTLGGDLIEKMSVTAATGGGKWMTGAGDTVGNGMRKDSGKVVFTRLLEGKYTVTVSGETATAAEANLVSIDDMQAVHYNAAKKFAGTEDFSGMSKTLQTVSATSNTVTWNQEVEYRGMISGYVFNNLDAKLAGSQQMTIDADEVMADVMVQVAQYDMMAGEPGRKMMSSESTHTDAKGKYEFMVWEGKYYEVMPMSDAFTGMPMKRVDFTVDEIVMGAQNVEAKVNYSYTSDGKLNTTKRELTMAAKPFGTQSEFIEKRGTDFEVVYGHGELDVTVTDGSGMGVPVSVWLEKCEAPRGVLGGLPAGEGVTTGMDGDSGSPPDPVKGDDGMFNFDGVVCVSRDKNGKPMPTGVRVRNAVNTDASGNVVWSGLDEGYYRVVVSDETVVGKTVNPDDNGEGKGYASIAQIHLPSAAALSKQVSLRVTVGS